MTHKTPAYLRAKHTRRMDAARRYFDALPVDQQVEAVREFSTATGRPTFYSAATCDTIAHMPAFLEFVARRTEERGITLEEDDEDDDEDDTPPWDDEDDDEDDTPPWDDEDDEDDTDEDDDEEF